MSATRLPVGSFVRIEKDSLQAILDCLRQRGFRTIGPTVRDGAVVFDDLSALDQLPIGCVDTQDGGSYRLDSDATAGYFDYVGGPDSLKRFLFPPSSTVLEAHRQQGEWVTVPTSVDPRPLAVVGVRSCDLRALDLQDRIFLRGEYVDPAYRAFRENMLVVAVNCRRAAATCFCHSMNSGPTCRSGFDLALTELDDCFVVEIGTLRGGEVATSASWTPCSLQLVHDAHQASEQLLQSMNQRQTERREDDDAPRGRYLETADLRELLVDNLQHPRWDEVARRCLACANCTLVCPTCFCSSMEERVDLSGEHVRRERNWASCFTEDHSYMSSGTVRKTIASRYRQWLTHKLAGWWDQFGASGCVGCGRCITWCPVGIDLTEEAAAIRGAQP
jgi:ferredoxin